MGLCKCPKKKVTNLFCFEHRVNVCENCLVESHASCVVQSYLQWLTDSDYDPNCFLCESQLNTSETIRLKCLHVFHWDCLNGWAHNFPETTAPAGYQCPNCSTPIFPGATESSLLIDKLREKLQTTNWARAGLGLPILPNLPNPVTPLRKAVANETDTESMSVSIASSPRGEVNDAPAPASTHSHRSHGPTVVNIDEVYSLPDRAKASSRKKVQDSNPDEEPLFRSDSTKDADDNANKYKRRPAHEWLGGLWRAKYGKWRLTCNRKYRTIGILAAFLFLMFIFISAMGHSSDTDPLLDPMANPNIRIAAD